MSPRVGRVAESLDYLSRALVVVSAAIALVVAAQMGARGWPRLASGTGVLFVAGFVLARWRPRWAWWPLLASFYLGPALLVALRNDTLFWDDTLWFGALLGAILGANRWRWSFPRPWRWPLIVWALSVSLVWPVVAFREMDGEFALLDKVHIGLSGLGGPPSLVIGWIAIVALTHILGLLWLDVICAVAVSADRRTVLQRFGWPLAFSVALGSLLALYQGMVDISWLSGHQWPSIGRAAGGLADGNAFGALAGFWVGGFVVLSASTTSRTARWLSLGGAVLCWGGLWMTGSRMALLAGLVCTLFALAGFARARLFRTPRARWIALAAGLVAVLALVGVVRSATTMNPVARAMDFMPPPTMDGLKNFARTQLWNRNGPFGSAGMEILRQSPLVGVGVGCFQHFFPDIAYQLTGDRFFFDNAQSWPRHQLAEFGLLGSIGWLSCGVLLLRALWRSRSPFGDISGLAVKGVVVSFIVVSLFSMPSQNVMVALTFWFVLGWFLVEMNMVVPTTAVATRAERGWPIALALALAFTFAGVTFVEGQARWRPPYRAVRADWNFQYGFYNLERPPTELPFRWTGRHAVDVFPVPADFADGFVRVSVYDGPPDVKQRPIRLRISRDDQEFADIEAFDGHPHTWYVAARGQKYLMVEIELSRSWTPSEFGASSDPRELGVRVADWSFVREAPPDSQVVR